MIPQVVEEILWTERVKGHSIKSSGGLGKNGQNAKWTTNKSYGRDASQIATSSRNVPQKCAAHQRREKMPVFAFWINTLN
jgi:hypothetical protein